MISRVYIVNVAKIGNDLGHMYKVWTVLVIGVPQIFDTEAGDFLTLESD